MSEDEKWAKEWNKAMRDKQASGFIFDTLLPGLMVLGCFVIFVCLCNIS